jgi:hypothetical protein
MLQLLKKIDTNVPLFIAVRLKANHRFHGAAILLFYILQKYFLNKRTENWVDSRPGLSMAAKRKITATAVNRTPVLQPISAHYTD